jgi:hypothetical protein
LKSSPQCIEPASGQIHCFALGTADDLQHTWSPDGGNTWRPWEHIAGSIIKSPPSCVVANYGQPHCFALSQTGTMLHKWWDPGQNKWKEDDQGGVLKSPPQCVVPSLGHINCFALASGGSMQQQFWNGSRWNPAGWQPLGQPLGGSLASPPQCVVPSSGNINCFALDSNGLMQQQFWNGSRWNPAGWQPLGQPLGGSFASPPQCVVPSPGNINCFALDSNGSMQQQFWNGSRWNPAGWQPLGGSLASPPQCVVPSPGNINCFALDSNGSMQQQFWNGSRWNPAGWEPLGGSLASPPECMSPSVGQIDCFALLKVGATAGYKSYVTVNPNGGPQDMASADCGILGPHYAQISCPALSQHAHCWCATQSVWGQAECQCLPGAAQPPPAPVQTCAGSPGGTNATFQNVSGLPLYVYYSISNATTINCPQDITQPTSSFTNGATLSYYVPPHYVGTFRMLTTAPADICSDQTLRFVSTVTGTCNQGASFTPVP